MTEQSETSPEGAGGTEERWPVGFMIFVGLAAVYLLIRVVQMAGWAIDRLF